MKYHEKEIKLEINDYQKVMDSLKIVGADFLGNAFQRTIRFEKGKGELEKKGLFLRVRSGFKNTLTMKIKVDNANVFEREEIELEVEDVEKVRKIMNKLGFDKELIMEKYRSKWKLGSVDICVDELPFGFFVEIEGDEKNIFETVKKLGLKKEGKITVTYWDLFEDYKKQTGKDLGKNIVFPNNYESNTRKHFA